MQLQTSLISTSFTLNVKQKTRSYGEWADDGVQAPEIQLGSSFWASNRQPPPHRYQGTSKQIKGPRNAADESTQTAFSCQRHVLRDLLRACGCRSVCMSRPDLRQICRREKTGWLSQTTGSTERDQLAEQRMRLRGLLTRRCSSDANGSQNRCRRTKQSFLQALTAPRAAAVDETMVEMEQNTETGDLGGGGMLAQH